MKKPIIKNSNNYEGIEEDLSAGALIIFFLIMVMIILGSFLLLN